MSYKIAIPSYDRPLTLRNKTLDYIKKTNMAHSDITVFVANKKEYDSYRELNPNVKFVIGVETLMSQRNFINKYYKEGEKVIMFDDDISGLYMKLSDKKTELVTDLDSVCYYGFDAAETVGNKIFGIYPVFNPYFMKNKTTLNLKYIVGCFWGCIIDHSKDLEVTLEDKEDYERTIKYYLKFGSSPRLNYITPKTNYYNEKGGMQVTRTEERVTWSAKELLKRYPLLCSLNTSKKSTKTEIKLRDKR